MNPPMGSYAPLSDCSHSEAMEGSKRRNGRGRPQRDFSEFGEVRVFSKPAPDAEDRLRRLFTMLLGHSARENRTEAEQKLPTDDRHPGNPLEAEA